MNYRGEKIIRYLAYQPGIGFPSNRPGPIEFSADVIAEYLDNAQRIIDNPRGSRLTKRNTRNNIEKVRDLLGTHPEIDLSVRR